MLPPWNIRGFAPPVGFWSMARYIDYRSSDEFNPSKLGSTP
jgi:hypothetical protein